MNELHSKCFSFKKNQLLGTDEILWLEFLQNKFKVFASFAVFSVDIITKYFNKLTERCSTLRYRICIKRKSRWFQTETFFLFSQNIFLNFKLSSRWQAIFRSCSTVFCFNITRSTYTLSSFRCDAYALRKHLRCCLHENAKLFNFSGK